MKIRTAGLLLLVPMVLVGIHASSAFAGTVSPLIVHEQLEWGPIPLFDGGGGQTLQFSNFDEEFDGPMGLRLRYTVTNPAGNGDGDFPYPAIAFAVSVPDGLHSEGEFLAWTNRGTWRAEVLDRVDWDGYDPNNSDELPPPPPPPPPGSGLGHGWLFGALSDKPGPGETTIPGRDGFTTDQFGSFEENFGGDFGDIQFAQVAFYFDNNDTQNSIGPGDTEMEFFFYHPGLAGPASTTISILTTGNAPSAGAQGIPGVTGIPLPSAAWMGLGLLGVLAAIRRRRRAR